MSAKVEIVRTPQGEYGWRLTDEFGKVVRIQPGSTGLKTSAQQRADDKRAIQAGLKALYERQQAEAS